MRLEAYVLNTIPTTQRWHLTSIANQCRYFSNHGIKFNVVDKRHHLIRKTQKYCNRWVNFPLMRKVYRVYDFLESGADYGIFMDLDKLILHPEKHPSEAMDLNTSYLEIINYFKNPKCQEVVDNAWRNHDPKTNNRMIAPLFDKVDFCNLLAGGEAFSWPSVCGGFYAFTREMAEFIVSRWSDMGINPTTSSGIERLTELNHEINRLSQLSIASDRSGGFVDGQEKFFVVTKEGYTPNGIHDEHLLCSAFMDDGGESVDRLKFNINGMIIAHALAQKDLLTSTWNVVKDHNVEWASWQRTSLCEEKIARSPALFLHLIGAQAKKNAHLYEKYKVC